MANRTRALIIANYPAPGRLILRLTNIDYRPTDQSSSEHTVYRPRWRVTEDRSSERGFTVIEVVVALAIFSLSVTVLFSTIADALSNTASAEAMSRAGILAQSVLNRVGRDIPIQRGTVTGNAADGSRWRVQITPFTSSPGIGQTPVELYQIAAEVRLSDLKGSSVALTTLRFGPRETRP